MGNRKLLLGTEKKYKFFFERSSEPLFIVDTHGQIVDLNAKGLELFSNSNKAPLLNFFSFFYDQHEKDDFWKQLKKKKTVLDFKTKFINNKREIIDILLSAKTITDKNSMLIGFEGIIKPADKIKKLVAKAIIDTQEKERERFANDLHDNLSQQLSAIKFHLATLQSLDLSTNHKRILLNSDEIINTLLVDIRSTCFNLAPTTLQRLGLKHAVSELCRKTESNGKLEFCLAIDANFPAIEKATEINTFRVIQEFINNSIKHGNATKISITMDCFAEKNKVIVLLEDNGIGFKIKNNMQYPSNGMGLKNIKNRVELCNGSIKMESRINKGTTFKITIPYLNKK